MTEELFGTLTQKVIAADREGLNQMVQEALAKGISAKDLLDKGLLPGMDAVGQRMKKGEMFIPEVLQSARAMQGAMSILQPHMSQKDRLGLGTVVIGTVQGDLHDIGKNLVAMMLKGGGFNVVDLGTDIKPQEYVEAVKTHKPIIVGMSALLTTTMPRMKETIDSLKEAGLRDKVKVMVGGAPVNEKFVKDIGGDAYAPNAAAAVETAKKIAK
jgi:5-methyltetrahydrofolate--homocysteine methyltransferase